MLECAESNGFVKIQHLLVIPAEGLLQLCQACIAKSAVLPVRKYATRRAKKVGLVIADELVISFRVFYGCDKLFEKLHFSTKVKDLSSQRYVVYSTRYKYFVGVCATSSMLESERGTGRYFRTFVHLHLS